ncbi:Mn-dependent DtxR family transcriptional regulator [Parvibaculum indicum]|uniref:hypothetical protein n=1 Tax=Parvibaculum indicum TaxID=562969 RepID=UPI0014212B8C|nr:hypothetical protein [Parvibaculum indicum]NIJ40395.1 Mn-dependent DtxR family transcriptional regulator [Parvibaculum indicum]
MGHSNPPTDEVRLSDLETEALTAWRNGGVDMGISFKAVASRTTVRPDRVRRVVRALARKGMVVYAQTLWNEEGMRGAGYCLTEAGGKRLAAIMLSRGWSERQVAPIRRRWEFC